MLVTVVTFTARQFQAKALIIPAPAHTGIYVPIFYFQVVISKRLCIKGFRRPDGQTLPAKNESSIAKVKNQYIMFVFTPAEPEAQASRLWWMVGFIVVSIAVGRFCLAD